MSRLLSPLAALADTTLAVVIGLLAPLTVATTGWLASGSFQHVSWDVPLTAAMTLWTLALTGSATVTVQPAAYPGLGLSEPFQFAVSLAPLALTAFVAWFAWHTGRRAATADDAHPWLALATSAIAFPLLNFAALRLGARDAVALDQLGVLIGGAGIWLAGLAIGARVWEYLPWQRLLGERTDGLLRASGHTVRLALGLTVGTLTLASVAVALGLLLGMGDIIGLRQLLQLDAWGNTSLGLVELLYLPTLVVWAASWLLGAGVQLGTGSMATLGGTDAGPLPVLPLLGIVPEPQSPLLWALVALPVLGAALLTMWLRHSTPALDRGPWWQRLAVPACASLLAAAALALLAVLARGGIGPGRLSDFGPVPWQLLVAALAVFLVGTSAGALIPLPGFWAERGVDARADRDAAARPGWWSRSRTEPEPAAAPNLSNVSNLRELREKDTEDYSSLRELGGGPGGGSGALGEPDDDFYSDIDAEMEAANSAAADASPDDAAPADNELDGAQPNSAELPGPAHPATSRDRPDPAHPATSRERPDPAHPATSRERPDPAHPATSRERPSLADAVRRPGEPDIYAGLDDD